MMLSTFNDSEFSDMEDQFYSQNKTVGISSRRSHTSSKDEVNNRAKKARERSSSGFVKPKSIQKSEFDSNSAAPVSMSLFDQENAVSQLINDIATIKGPRPSDLRSSLSTPPLPVHLLPFKDMFEKKVKHSTTFNYDNFPIFHQISPRTKKKLSVIPKPDETELAQIYKYQEDIKKIKSNVIYDNISSISATALSNAHRMHGVEPMDQIIESITGNNGSGSSRGGQGQGQGLLHFINNNKPSSANTSNNQTQTVIKVKTMFDRANNYKRLKDDRNEKFQLIFSKPSDLNLNLNQFPDPSPSSPASVNSKNANTLPAILIPKSLSSNSNTNMNASNGRHPPYPSPSPFKTEVLTQPQPQALNQSMPQPNNAIAASALSSLSFNASQRLATMNVNPNTNTNTNKTSASTSTSAYDIVHEYKPKSKATTKTLYAPDTAACSIPTTTSSVSNSGAPAPGLALFDRYNLFTTIPSAAAVNDLIPISTTENNSNNIIKKKSSLLNNNNNSMKQLVLDINRNNNNNNSNNKIENINEENEKLNRNKSTNNLLSISTEEDHFNDVDTTLQSPLPLPLPISHTPIPIPIPTPIAMSTFAAVATQVSSKSFPKDKSNKSPSLITIVQEPIQPVQYAKSPLPENQVLVHPPSRTQTQQHGAFMDNMRISLYDELGLNVDEKFTKRRFFSNASKTLLYYVYTKILKDCMKHWKYQSNEVTLALEMKSVTCIARVMRGKLARMRHAKILENMRIRQEAAINAIKKRNALLHFSAFVLSKALRVYCKRQAIRRHIVQRLAATNIQRIFRSFAAHTKFQIMKIHFKLVTSKAVFIQCAYRQHLAKRKVKLYQKLEIVTKYLEYLKVVEKKRILEYRRIAASWIIARYYRAYRNRKAIKRMIYWHRFELAVDIQRVFRGSIARKDYRQIIQAKELKELKDFKAAVVIQSMVRRHEAMKALKLLKYLKIRRREKMYQQKLDALSKAPNLKNSLQRYLRNFMISKYDFYNSNAVQIQKIWRGYKKKKRYFMIKSKHIVEEVMKEKKTKISSAIKIQKYSRGFLCRLKIKRKKQDKMAISIQCLWRLITSKRLLVLYRRRKRALALIAVRLLIYVHSRRRHKRKLFERKYLKPIKIIQAFLRRTLARCDRRMLKLHKRSRLEELDLASHRLNEILISLQLKLVHDCIGRPIQYRVKPLFPTSAGDCLCNGPLQSLFVLAAVHRGKPESNSLILNKLDKSNLLKFLMKIEGLMKGGKSTATTTKTSVLPRTMNKQAYVQQPPNTASPAPVKTSKIQQPTRRTTGNKTTGSNNNNNKKKPAKPKYLLLEAIRSKLIDLPNPAMHLKATDVDILYAKAKDSAASKGMSYLEFCRCMALLADRFYGKDTSSNSNAARPGSPSLTAPNNHHESDNEEEEKEDNEEVENNESNDNAEVIELDDTDGGKSNINTNPINSLKFPLDAVSLPANFVLSLFLQALVSFAREDWMGGVIDWLTTESRARLAFYAQRIQNMCRMKLARNKLTGLKVNHKKSLLSADNTRIISMIQSYIRRFLGRQRMARLFQRFIIKYVPFDSQPYWYNPNTRISSYSKPKPLMNLECTTVALPPPGLENIVTCSSCTNSRTPAACNCIDCEESFCKICFDSVHSKGRRITHVKMVIPFCSYCKIQMASKNCHTCSICKPLKGSTQELLQPSERGLSCDVCFMYIHDSYEKYLEGGLGNNNRKGNTRQLINITKEAYLVGHQLHQRIITHHRFDHLIQPCEECLWRGASWRCLDCKQIYCNFCLNGMHSLGGPFSKHIAERVPYYTPVMHESYQRDLLNQINRKKLLVMSKLASKIAEERKYASILKIQSWWRMMYYSRIGRKYMRVKRKNVRIRYKRRAKETKEIRSTRSYQILHFLGLASVLESDTREEAVLGVVSAFRRNRARDFISRNKSDKGWFGGEGEGGMGKGVTKAGFDVGSVEELQDQARRGGYRMPGRVFVKYGKKKFKTSVDLENILMPGELVRIGSYFFGVESVENCEIVLDRCWRGKGTVHGTLPGTWELIYRLPCYRNEPGRLAFKMRYTAFDVMVGRNPLVQMCIDAYIAYLQRQKADCVATMKAYAGRGQLVEAGRWKDSVRYYSMHIGKAGVYRSGEGRLVDLSLAESPQERAVREERLAREAVLREDRRSRREAIMKDAIGAGVEVGERDTGGQGEGGARDRVGDWTGAGDRDITPPPLTPKVVNTYMVSESNVYQNMESIVKSAANGNNDDNHDEYMDQFLEQVNTTGTSPSIRPARERDINADNNSETSSSSSLISSPSPSSSRKPITIITSSKSDKAHKAQGKNWQASREEVDVRMRREENMSAEELAAEAHEWEECFDPMTEVVYFVHKPTGEMMGRVPRAVECYRRLQADKERTAKTYDVAMKKIENTIKSKDNRILISGARKWK